MKVVPVIDILNGVTVHAVRGKRSEYHSLTSVLCDSANPLEVASALKTIGFSELYIADLDAITGKGDNFDHIKQIAEKTGLELMVDAGVTDMQRAEVLVESQASKVIVGTETLRTLKFLTDALQRFGSDRVAVSLDLKQRNVLSVSPQISSTNAVTLALRLQSLGLKELIVLDLARVGSSEGVDQDLLRQLLQRLQIKVDVGGGVHDIKELLVLRGLGINAALVATALHSGKISIAELRKMGFIQS